MATVVVREPDAPVPVRAERERGFRWRPSSTAAAVGVFALVGAARAERMAEGDTFWQIRAGDQVLRDGTVFLRDTFSWSMAGRPWHPNSWLFDVALSIGYRAGPVGLGILTIVLLAAVGATVGAAARGLGARPGAVAVTACLAVLPLEAWLSTRPQTASYAFLVAVTLLVGKVVWARGRRLAGGLLAVYLLSAVWVNVHLAALGVLPAAAGGLAALLLAHRARWRALLPAAAGILAALALGVTTSPFGLGALRSALLTRDASTADILEWAPLWRASGVNAFTWAGAALAVALAAAAWRRRPGSAALPVWVGTSAVLLVLGVDAARFGPMALVVALPAAAAWVSGTDWKSGRGRWRAAFLARGLTVALLVTFAVLAVAGGANLGRPTPGKFPSAALVRAIPAGCRVLNEYNDGGWLILQRTDDGVRVAVDGRNDAYGVALFGRAEALERGTPGALDELAADHVGCLLLAPARPLVAQALAAGWRRAGEDTSRVLLLAP